MRVRRAALREPILLADLGDVGDIDDPRRRGDFGAPPAANNDEA
jgi:hypothetical protein